MFNWVRNIVERFIRRIILDVASSQVSGERLRLKENICDPEVVRVLSDALSKTPTIWGEVSRISVGKNVHLVNALLNTSSGSIKIGDNTFFGHNVSLITGTHPIEEEGVARQRYPDQGRDIIVGEGVWIASNAVVLGPCRIGDGAVIAAGAVVTGGAIPPNVVYGGIPAKCIRAIQPLRDVPLAQ